MNNKNSKKIVIGALSAMAASVVASVAARKLLKNSDKEKNNEKKKNKSFNYTVKLEDIYNSYDDKTLSEEDMINEIKKESSL